MACPSLLLRASVRLPWLRFQSPLIEPCVRISRTRLSDEIMPSPTESGSFGGPRRIRPCRVHSRSYPRRTGFRVSALCLRHRHWSSRLSACLSIAGVGWSDLSQDEVVRPSEHQSIEPFDHDLLFQKPEPGLRQLANSCGRCCGRLPCWAGYRCSFPCLSGGSCVLFGSRGSRTTPPAPGSTGSFQH